MSQYLDLDAVESPVKKRNKLTGGDAILARHAKKGKSSSKSIKRAKPVKMIDDNEEARGEDDDGGCSDQLDVTSCEVSEEDEDRGSADDDADATDDRFVLVHNNFCRLGSFDQNYQSNKR